MKPWATCMAKLIHNLELLRRIYVSIIVHVWLPNHTFAEASTWKPLLYWHTYIYGMPGDDTIRTSNMRSSACFERKTGNKNHRTLANSLGAEQKAWAFSPNWSKTHNEFSSMKFQLKTLANLFPIFIMNGKQTCHETASHKARPAKQVPITQNTAAIYWIYEQFGVYKPHL